MAKLQENNGINYTSFNTKDSKVAGENKENDGATGNNSMAIGIGASTVAANSLVVGNEAKVTYSGHHGQIAIGHGTTTYMGMAIGYQAHSEHGIAIGQKSKSMGAVSVAVGDYAQTDGQGGVSIGSDTYTKFRSVAIGQDARANDENAVSLGSEATIYAEDSIAAGSKSIVYGDASIAIGLQAAVKGKVIDETAYNALADEDKKQYVLEKYFTRDYKVPNGLIEHHRYVKIENVNNLSATDSYNAIAMGSLSLVGAKSGIAIGALTNVQGKSAMALGYNAKGQVADGVAIGSYAISDREKNVTGYNPISGKQFASGEEIAKALGKAEEYKAAVSKTEEKFLVAKEKYAIYKSNPNEENRKSSLEANAEYYASRQERDRIIAPYFSSYGGISVGTEYATRQITNVAAGTEDTDAVNVAQLKALNTKVDDNKIKYVSIKSTEAGNKDNLGASGTDSIAVGPNAQSIGKNSIALGSNVKASIGDAIVIGSNITDGKGIVIGVSSAATAKESIAIGVKANASGNARNTAIGWKSEATGDYSVAYGQASKAWGVTAVALGPSAIAQGQASLAIGNKAEANVIDPESADADSADVTDQAIAIGDRAIAKKEASLALGARALSSNDRSTALGFFAIASGVNSASVGANSEASGVRSVAMGASAKAEADRSIAIGANSMADRASNSYGYVPNATAFTSEADIIRYLGKVDEYNELTKQLVDKQEEINKKTEAYQNDPDNRALKKEIKNATNELYVILDERNKLSAAYRSGLGAVSVGNEYATRQITNVAAGTEDTDAVNVAQLKALRATGLNFKGDTADVLHRELGDQLNLIGGANASELTDNNIGVVADVDTKDNMITGLRVKLAKNINLPDDGSVRIGGTTDEKGTLTGGIYIGEQTPMPKVGDKDVPDKAVKGLYITGLANTDWSPESGIVENRAATEKQLQTAISNISSQVGEAGVWKLQVNSTGERPIKKDSIINFKDGSKIKIAQSGDDITIGVDPKFVQQVDQNTTQITNIGGKVSKLETTVNNITNNGIVTKIEGDTDTGIKVTPVDEKDASKGVKVGLDKEITVGGIKIDGSIEKDGNTPSRTITGLTNTSWNGKNYVTGRAATEDQLHAVDGKITNIIDNIIEIAGATTIKEGDGNIIAAKTDGKNEYTLSLNKDLKVGNSITVGDTVKINNTGIEIGDTVKITNTGIDAGNKPISNIEAVELKENGNYAATTGQVFKVQKDLSEQISGVANVVQNNSHQILRLDTKINKSGAGLAALAALHPLDYDPDNKWNFTAGVGTYHGSSSVALGAFYRPNENTMFSVGGTLGNGEDMMNFGVSMKFGESNPYAGMSKGRLIEYVEQQTTEIDDLKAQNESQNERIKKLEELVQSLMISK